MKKRPGLAHFFKKPYLIDWSLRQSDNCESLECPERLKWIGHLHTSWVVSHSTKNIEWNAAPIATSLGLGDNNWSHLKTSATSFHVICHLTVSLDGEIGQKIEKKRKNGRGWPKFQKFKWMAFYKMLLPATLPACLDAKQRLQRMWSSITFIDGKKVFFIVLNDKFCTTEKKFAQKPALR